MVSRSLIREPFSERNAMISHACAAVWVGIQAPCGAELFDTLLKALKDLEAGNTADDIDYEWQGNVCKAHPYQPENRRIVYKEQRTGDSK